MPDEKHIEQVESVLENSDREVWLLVKGNRLQAWHTELDGLEPGQRHRVVVASVESFVGQNVTELGAFSAKGKLKHLGELFRIYNEAWIATLGPASLRIEIK